MARIGVLYDKDIKERVFGVFATNDSTDGYLLTLTASPTNITKGQSSTITATLTYNGNVVQGENVTFKIGSTTVSTGTTDANGKATYTYQSTVVGTIYITASSNNVRGVVDIAIKNYQLTLTTNKSIIGKTDTATITALLTDNGSSVSNETLSYVIKHGSTTISSGSKNTDSNGKATISYTGTGVGDVKVIVSYGSLLQETYEVKDGLFIDTSTTPNNKWWSTSTNGSVTHDSSGVIFNNTGTSYSRMHPYTVETFPPTWSEKENAAKFIDTPFIVEFDVISVKNTNQIILDTNTTIYTNDISANDHVKLVCDGSTGKVYINGELVDNKSFTFTNSWFALRITSTVELTIDNFVVYPI